MEYGMKQIDKAFDKLIKVKPSIRVIWMFGLLACSTISQQGHSLSIIFDILSPTFAVMGIVILMTLFMKSEREG